MKYAADSSRFFGLDVGKVFDEWLSAIRLIGKWPLARWLAPAYFVRLLLSDGRSADYGVSADSTFAHRTQYKSARFYGALLPEDLVLWQSALMPDLGSVAMFAAIELRVSSLSPFLADDTVWTFATPDQKDVNRQTQIAIVSRKMVTRYLDQTQLKVPLAKGLEAWVSMPQSDKLLILPGFGEQRREKLTSAWRLVNAFLVLTLAGIALAAAIVPTVQLHLRAAQATQQYAALTLIAQPVLRLRESNVVLEQKTKTIEDQLRSSISPELVLLRLTKLLPDDTYIASLQVQASKVVLTGQAPNASALMQQLGAQAGIRNVRAPSASFKARGSDRDSFTVEFSMDASSLTQ